MEYYGNLNISPYAQLYHHGVNGMKWGVKNGPPYPLSSDVSTGNSLKISYGSRDGGLFRKKKKKKSIDQVDRYFSSMDYNGDTIDEDAYRAMKKQQMLRKADPKEIKAHYQELTDNELANAVTRIRNLEAVNQYIPKEKTALNRLDDLTNTINSVNNFTSKAITFYNNSMAVREIVKSIRAAKE